MFPMLAEAVEELAVPVDGRAIAAAIALRDRVDAKIAEAVGHFDADSLWDLDAATSMTAWLRSAADLSRRDASRLAMAAKRLRCLPATAEGWRSGALSSGQVNAIVGIVGIVGERHLERFADHEAALVPTLAPLPVDSVVRVMQAWKAKAEALDDEGDDDAEPERSLAPVADHGRALRAVGLARRRHRPRGGHRLTPGHHRRLRGRAGPEPAERRADALGDVCRFLPRPPERPAGRASPAACQRGGRPRGPRTRPQRALDRRHRPVRGGYGRVGVRLGPAPGPDAGALHHLGLRHRHPQRPRPVVERPGCDRPPAWCEAHHVVWFSEGGATSLDNLVLGCSRHHHRLHQRGWEAKLHPDGTFEVTAPDGRHWVTYPPGAAARLC